MEILNIFKDEILMKQFDFVDLLLIFFFIFIGWKANSKVNKERIAIFTEERKSYERRSINDKKTIKELEKKLKNKN